MNPEVVDSVAAFLGISPEELLERHDGYLPHQLARWRRLAPADAAGLGAFYNDNLYLYELVSTPRFGLVHLVEPFLPPASSILDYGCGIGTHGLHFLRRGHRVAFCDVPSPHLDYVRWVCAQEGLAADFVEAVARLPDRSLDAIFCFDVLEHVLDWREAIGHFARLLREDGKLFLIVSFTEFEEEAIHISARTGLNEQSFGACMAESGLQEIYRRDRPVPLSQPLEPFRVFSRAPSEAAARISRRFEEGEGLLREGSLAEAERCFEEAVAWNPQDFASRRVLARIHLSRGRLAEAEAEVGKVLELLPEDIGAMELRADLLLKSGDAAGAARRYADAIAAWPEHTAHSKQELRSLLESGTSFEDAAGHIEGWRKLQALLVFLLEIRDYARAEALARRLAADHPQQSYAGYLVWKEFARLLRETGRVAEAIEVLRQLIAHHPDRLWLHFDLAQCHVAAGDGLAAVAEFNEEERCSPFRAVICLERGKVLRGLGNVPGALADFRRLGALLPEDAQVHFELGELEWASRNYWKALLSFEAAHRLAPERMWPRFSPKMKLAIAARGLAARLRRS